MSGRAPIAIVGMACRYPDARSPAELWENALAQRRAFRRIPSTRLNNEDYFSADHATADSVYTLQAAVIEGYEFDRHRFKISGSTFRSVDMAHWLALDIAAAAIDDAGFENGTELPRQNTGVLLGNTLTGEFSRANLMRTRWPYVRRTVEAALAAEQWDAKRRGKFLADLERQFKSPFPPGNEETLAGGLSNTIAGRICNYFDLKGGGYTVDGACASSLLAVITACSLLSAGELDVALAGGVDLSLDPFELVGFSRAGALAEREMTVYDIRSQGFWPGEGCGFVTLMREEDAKKQNRRIYATLRGWGVSSDGAGGITRPEVDGQVLALQRAYRGLEFTISDVAYFEGHGTGTAVGDTTELRALNTARQQAGANGHRAAIGSIKANIGHTKAAAGVAGLIKAAMALHEQVQPAPTACGQPHSQFAEPDCSLQILRSAREWPEDEALCAGVSAMGFGGINTHVVLQGDRTAPRRPHHFPAAQDCELFLFDAADPAALREQLLRLRSIAENISRSELCDVSAALAKQLTGGAIRAAVVASDPAMLAKRLDELLKSFTGRAATKIDPAHEIFLGVRNARPRIGLLCCGQGYAISRDGGAVARRFPLAGALYDPPICGDTRLPQVVQPGVVRASLAAIRVLKSLGIPADLAIGHSLGELTALCWAGAFDEQTILQLAMTRGQIMADLSPGDGAMASIGADPATVQTLLADSSVGIACYNGPHQTVISGPTAAVRAVVATAQEHRLAAVILKTTHAFHSPLVAAAAEAFPRAVSEAGVRPMRRKIISSVTGEMLADSRSLDGLLGRQITSPVLFSQAIAKASSSVDLFIEVGSGDVLTRMVADLTAIPAMSIDVGGESIRGLLNAAAAAFALGADVDHAALFENRIIRPFSLDWKPKFFTNPCESAPLVENHSVQEAQAAPVDTEADRAPTGASPLDVLRQVIARQEELQPQSIRPQSHLLRDLHLNSLKVAEIVAKASRQLGLPAPASPTEMSGATVGQIALAFEEQMRTTPALVKPAAAVEDSPFPPGVDSWVRSFKVEWIAQPLAMQAQATSASQEDSPQRAAEGRRGANAETTRDELPQNPPSAVLPLRHSAHLCGEFSSSDADKLESKESWQENQKSRDIRWQIFGETQNALGALLKSELSAAMPQGGVALLLPVDPDSKCIPAMLASARAALANFSPASPGIFIVVHQGGGGAAFAKTVSLECPGITVCVVDVPKDHPIDAGSEVHRRAGSITEEPGSSDYLRAGVVGTQIGYESACKRVIAEALAANGYTESRYDGSGRRFVPTLVATGLAESSAIGLGPQDVLLVTGGGKGIAAECALELACKTAARLLILGRSHPEQDAELAANLARLTRRGVSHGYEIADVTDLSSVAGALRRGQASLGNVTAIIHGAGTNTPRLLSQLDEESFLQTLRPKCDGLRNLLAAVDADRLKILVTFGSVIARIGMRGEADYAVANEWMGRLVEQFQQRHPMCRCLNLEWSVWSGVGMGPRLGSITPLIAQGISPISPDAGVRKLLELLGDPGAAGSMIVSGRYGDLSTLKSEAQFKPARFVRTARCFYPGVELVADTEFSMATDPYLADHIFHGRCLLPGVVGLEMMAEAAAIVTGESQIGAMEEIRFDHPIEIPQQGKIVLRVAALVRPDGRIDVVVRSAATRFAVNHFTAVYTAKIASAPKTEASPGQHNADAVAASLDPQRDLYGRILFQGRTFQRIESYELLRARHCVVRIRQGNAVDGLGARSELVLGDPAGRDAAIHAIQACIPHITVLPVSIQTLEVFRRIEGVVRMVARERECDATGFVYDLSIFSQEGELVERWSGLRLQIASEKKIDGPWPAGLLPPYLERRIGDLISVSGLGVELESNGHAGAVHDSGHRPDGKPDACAGRQISRTYFHSNRLTCTSGGPVAVDAEAINGKTADQWAQVLGSQRMALSRTMSESSREPLAHSASRVWCATECLGKLSAAADAPLTMSTTAADGWTMLRSGQITIASYVAPVGEMGDVCLAFAAGEAQPKAYEFTVRVGFDEVNRMGTVNFQSYFNWQARCREAFLHDHVPSLLRDLHQGAHAANGTQPGGNGHSHREAALLLVTTDASCEYLAEISPEREVLLRMTLGELGEHRVTMRFEYVQNLDGNEVVVARGRQTTASMHRGAAGLVAVPVPAALRTKLAEYSG